MRCCLSTELHRRIGALIADSRDGGMAALAWGAATAATRAAAMPAVVAPACDTLVRRFKSSDLNRRTRCTPSTSP
jgi:hypothetical protein